MGYHANEESGSTTGQEDGASAQQRGIVHHNAKCDGCDRVGGVHVFS